MTNPTSNFGWQMPTSTDLVTDLPADFETFGQAVDTSLAELKGGTTGQILSKASNTDMDFTWVADAGGISPTIFDAKGDLIAASAADTAARLAVGANGTILEAASGETTGLKWGAAWTAFTPILQNVTIGNGTLSAAYAKIGKTVYVYGEFTLGSTSAITGFIGATHPITAQIAYPFTPLGRALFRDAGTALYFGDVIGSSNTTNIEIFPNNTSGTYASYTAAGSTVPFTWTTGDYFSYSYTYQAA